MPRILYAMNEPELQAYISCINNISLIRADMAATEITMAVDKILLARDNQPEPLTIDESGVGHINIVGVLQQNIDPCALMFGGATTAYFEIINGAISAEKNPEVKETVFHFDTPGGGIIGLEKAANVIKNMTKPTRAVVHGQCCSAGLFLASQCDTIEAEGELCEVGSLGVKAVVTDTTAKDRSSGITKYTIVSENAPNKVMDFSKKEDRLKFEKHITKMESIFIGFVALGRNTTPEFVRKNYGRGSVLIARDALNIGMIDSIQNEMINSDVETQNNSNQNASGMKNVTKILTEENTVANIEMSEEDFQARLNAASESGAKIALTAMDEKLKVRDLALSAETERKSGFITLSNRYPEMSAMITEESNKPEATANMDFFMKVVDADKARLSALTEQNTNSGTVIPETKPGEEEKLTAEAQNVSALAGALGINLEEVK